MKRYKWLELDDALADMELFEDILDPQGSTLLPAGTMLTESMLTSLRRRGIDTICVIDDSMSEAELEAERARVQQRLTILFRKCNAEHACKELLQHVTDYRLGGAK